MEQKQPPNPSQSRDWHFAGIRRQQRPNRKTSNFILELKNFFFLLEQRIPAFGISDFFLSLCGGVSSKPSTLDEKFFQCLPTFKFCWFSGLSFELFSFNFR